MQEECKDSQQLKEPQKLLPKFSSQSPPVESNSCSAGSSSQPGRLAWIVLCNTTAAVPEEAPGWESPAVSTGDDGSASAQSSLPCLIPSLGRLGCPCALSTLPVCSALHSPQEALPSLAVTVMWLLGLCSNPGTEMKLGETVITSVRLINE